MDNQPYIVLGMHRSGTSLTSAILHNAGIEMLHGAPNITNRESPIGYFENQKVMTLNDRILRIAGGSWKLPPSDESILKVQHKVAYLVRDIVEELNQYPKWGIKDPRLCLTYPHFSQFIPNPKFIIVVRDPEANYAGFKRVRFPFLHQKYRTEEYFYNLYDRHLTNALIFSNDHPTLVVKFEEYFTNDNQLHDILDFVESTTPIEELKKLINSKHRHH